MSQTRVPVDLGGQDEPGYCGRRSANPKSQSSDPTANVLAGGKTSTSESVMTTNYPLKRSTRNAAGGQKFAAPPIERTAYQGRRSANKR